MAPTPPNGTPDPADSPDLTKSAADESPATAAVPTDAEAKREIRQLAVRSVVLQSGFNYERFQNVGMWWALRPLLEKLYRPGPERAAAYKRHLMYFNTHPFVVGPILGIVAGMERRRAAGEKNLDDEAMNSVKVGMMAPLAGMGDSIVFGTIRPILSGVCATLAVQGNIAGPILFFTVMLAIQVLLRAYGTSIGYRQGIAFLEKLDPRQIDRVKESATIVGLAVVGALVATLIEIDTPLKYTKDEAVINVQTQLDTILPALLPLLAALGVFFAIRRRIPATWVLVGTTVVGLVGGYLGVIGAAQ
ncbi:PTS system mannose/fructose/sorbose family transporter subunit IID [Streptomyces sp. MAR4 CNX-425]|uniref:PTS system mannose/fructose/sorbose family transporter subunit IID n=1 Tax=Streptomyces sp. MAR4 CNX-425 TaxID=3406343 RepID=UPI003B50E2E8